MNFFEKRKKHKEFDRFINLRYEKWLEEQGNETPDEKFLREGFEVIQSTLKNMIESTKDEEELDILQAIYSIECKTEDDLYDKIYLFNDGDLKPREDVENLINYRYKKKEFKLGDYNKERHIVNVCTFFVPLIVTFVLFFMLFDDMIWIFRVPIALLLGLIASTIFMIVGYNRNIKRAKDYDIPEYDPRVQAEKLKLKVGIASSVAAGVGVLHHTKNAVKEVSDPDTWKEMK